MQPTKRRGQTARVYRAENVLEKPSPRLWARPEVRKADPALGPKGWQTAWEHNRRTGDAAREAGRKRCELWAGLITSSDFWRVRGLPRSVKVGKMQRNARTSRGGMYADGWKIRLSEHGMTPYVVLHELAHVADMAHARGRYDCEHTGTFTAWLLALVELGLGRSAADQLTGSLVEQGARIDTTLLEVLRVSIPAGHPAGGLWARSAHRIMPPLPRPEPAATPAPVPLAVAAKPTARLEPVAGVQGSLW